MLFLTLFYREMEQRLISEIEASHLSMLNQSVQRMDADLNTFIETASRISGDSLLTPFLLRHSGYSQIEAVRRLRIYNAGLGFVDSLLLYAHVDILLFTSNGTYSIHNFNNFIYDFRGYWDRSDFMMQLNSATSLVMPQRDNFILKQGAPSHQSVVAISAPWTGMGGISIGSVTALINFNHFRSYIGFVETDISHISFIIDNENSVFLQQGLAFDTDSWLAGEVHIGHTDIERIQIDGGRYSLLTIESQNGWRFMMLIPHRGLGYRVLPVNSPTVMLISFLFLFAIIIGILLAYKNWLPINRLLRRIKERDASPRLCNELMEIDTSIQAILSSQEEQERQVMDNMKLTRWNLLQILLNQSEGLESDSFKLRLEEAGLILTGPVYCVISVHVISDSVRTALIEAESYFTGLYIIDRTYKNYIAILLNLDNDNQNRVEEMIESLEGRISKTELIYGIGRLCKHLSSISRSNVESVLALEANMQINQQGFLTYDDLASKRISPLATEQLQLSLLIQGIRQSNTSVINKYVDNISNVLIGSHTLESESLLRFYTSIITHELMQFAIECAFPDADIYALRFIKYESLPEFIGILTEFCRDLCSFILKRSKSDKQQLFDSISEYINQNFTSLDMSLKLLSMEFSLSIQYLSHFFKEMSGKNFIDYITAKRMDLACQLLKTTKSHIQQICEEVGYINAPSFTRKFTEIYGISPGKYRQQSNKEVLIK